MNKTEKAEVIAEIVGLLNQNSSILLTDYSKINVEDISKIRREFRKEGISYKVFKNTLFKRALDEVGVGQQLAPHLKGMIGFVFAGENPAVAAKIIKKYNDDTSKLPLRAALVEGQFYPGSSLAALASLPTKPEIIAGILGSLNAPASGIVGAINAVMRDLASVIDEIAKKKAA